MSWDTALQMSRVPTGKKRGQLHQNKATVGWFLVPRTPATEVLRHVCCSLGQCFLNVNVRPDHKEPVKVQCRLQGVWGGARGSGKPEAGLGPHLK